MRIGTRGSALALTQARLVAEQLGDVEIVVVRTSGDAQTQEYEAANATPPPAGGSASVDRGSADKSRWVADLEQALLAGEIDLAVHSAKDVPGEPVAGLELLGAPQRAAPEDALIGARSLEDLPQGARVGTSSVRRAAQLRAARSDLEIVSMRGNVDTRLRKLAKQSAVDAGRSGNAECSDDTGRADGAGRAGGAGQSSDEDGKPLHAIVLASAGLHRLGRGREIGCELDVARFVPAPGQGLLALQAREGDESVRASVEKILDSDASACLKAERAVARALGASCHTPLGAYAVPAGRGCLHLRAWIGLPDGSEWIADELLAETGTRAKGECLPASAGFYDPRELGRRVAERLEAVGARELLARAEGMAVERV